MSPMVFRFLLNSVILGQIVLLEFFCEKVLHSPVMLEGLA